MVDLKWIFDLPDAAFRALAIPSMLLASYLLYELRSLYNRTIDIIRADNERLQEQANKTAEGSKDALTEAMKIVELMQRMKRE